MSKKVKVDELANAITETMTDYFGVTDLAVEKGVEETAKDALSQLRNAHPSGSGKYGSWDDYNKSWKIHKTKRDKTATIHNKNHYQLTHLLEKGHALVNGGRTRAFPHITPVAQDCEEKLLQNIKKNIEG